MKKFFSNLIALGFIALMALVIFFGLFLMSKGWSMIHASSGELVTGGIYRYVRHPQYVGLIVLTIGLLIQWPTIRRKTKDLVVS